MNNLKILIVEDDMELATMYRLKFDKEWFVTKIADNGLDAITLITELEPDVILLDIMMPGMDGFETLRVIRELAPSLKCKIVMFSNLNSKDDIDKCMSLGADGYLLKANTTPKEAVEKIYELHTGQKPETKRSENPPSSWNHNCPHCWGKIQVKVEVTV